MVTLMFLLGPPRNIRSLQLRSGVIQFLTHQNHSADFNPIFQAAETIFNLASVMITLVIASAPDMWQLTKIHNTYNVMG